MTYLKRLEQAHRIEVNGEATYLAAARFTRRPDRQAKWQALAELETLMKERIAAAIASSGPGVAERQLDAGLGRAVGFVLAFLPWRFMLHGLRVVTRHTMRFWQRLEREHPEEDPRLLADLVAHERAQVEFAERELAGREGRSLELVLDLLGAAGRRIGRSDAERTA
jgi:hypothetical protein